MNTKEIEDFIKLRLKENLKLMQAETGQRVNQNVVIAAERQALAYWHTMHMLAEKITETEVKLSLPECTTPKGRTFTIEGVVDIVKEDSGMSIYDIKTMPPDYVEKNKLKFAMQLNVYAHILAGLKGYKVKRAAVIATAPADALKRRFNTAPFEVFIDMLKSMDPFVEIPLDEASITDTITKFGEIVDRIQDGDFKPKSVGDLKRKDTDGGKTRQFGTDVCRNCDAGSPALLTENSVASPRTSKRLSERTRISGSFLQIVVSLSMCLMSWMRIRLPGQRTFCLQNVSGPDGART